jgi:hypothetical protein
MRIGCLILLPLCLAVAASAEDTAKLPDPFIDGLYIGDISMQVEAALKEDGWEITTEWYNLDIDPIYRVNGEKGNRRLFYEFNVYGRLCHLKYLEQWPAIKTRDSACETWSEWLSTIFGASDKGADGYPHWASEGYEAQMYNRTFYDDLNTIPTVMINIFPKNNYVLPTEDEINIRHKDD